MSSSPCKIAKLNFIYLIVDPNVQHRPLGLLETWKVEFRKWFPQMRGKRLSPLDKMQELLAENLFFRQ